tara:strand:+ start:1109 stop:1261 length:153 start_codon:yes stop_codon:yes gene_type:complete
MFKLQELKEWYARFRGRKFYSKVRKIYTRSNEINPSIESRKRFLKSIGDK